MVLPRAGAGGDRCEAAPEKDPEDGFKNPQERVQKTPWLGSRDPQQPGLEGHDKLTLLQCMDCWSRKVPVVVDASHSSR